VCIKFKQEGLVLVRICSFPTIFHDLKLWISIKLLVFKGKNITSDQLCEQMKITLVNPPSREEALFLLRS
jgi:hypothetical protein